MFFAFPFVASSDVEKPVFDAPCGITTTVTVENCRNTSSVPVNRPEATDNSGSVQVGIVIYLHIESALYAQKSVPSWFLAVFDSKIDVC